MSHSAIETRSAGVACMPGCDNDAHHDGRTGENPFAECTGHHHVGIVAGLYGQVVAVTVNLFRSHDEVKADVVVTPLDNIDGDGSLFPRDDSELDSDAARKLAQLLVEAADVAAKSARMKSAA